MTLAAPDSAASALNPGADRPLPRACHFSKQIQGKNGRHAPSRSLYELDEIPADANQLAFQDRCDIFGGGGYSKGLDPSNRLIQDNEKRRFKRNGCFSHFKGRSGQIRQYARRFGRLGDAGPVYGHGTAYERFEPLDEGDILGGRAPFYAYVAQVSSSHQKADVSSSVCGSISFCLGSSGSGVCEAAFSRDLSLSELLFARSK